MKINADLFEANYLHAFLLTENYITLTVSFTCSSHILLLLDSSIVYSNLFFNIMFSSSNKPSFWLGQTILCIIQYYSTVYSLFYVTYI